jgi:hypothetical protein
VPATAADTDDIDARRTDAGRRRRLGFDPSKWDRVNVPAHHTGNRDFYDEDDFGLPFVHYLVFLLDARKARWCDLRQDGIVVPTPARPRKGRDRCGRKEEEQ